MNLPYQRYSKLKSKSVLCVLYGRVHKYPESVSHTPGLPGRPPAASPPCREEAPSAGDSATHGFAEVKRYWAERGDVTRERRERGTGVGDRADLRG